MRSPDCEGYLHKKGHLVPSWKRRYFALYGSELSYFESEDACSRMRSQGKVFKGNLLKGQVKVTKYLDWSASLKPHSFMLETSNHKKKKFFCLIADDEEERKMWARYVTVCGTLSAVRKACGQEAVLEDTESAASEDLQSYCCTFSAAPVGIQWRSRFSASHGNSGLEKSAIVEKVSGAAEKSGKVRPGHSLVSINGRDVSEMNFRSTMNIVNKAEFPITLELLPSLFEEHQDHRFMSGEFRTWAVTLLKASTGVLQAAGKADHHHLVLAVDDEGIKTFNLQRPELKKKVEEVEVTLGSGPLGLDMTTNFSGKRIYGINSGRRYSGLDFSAVVQTVSGPARDTNIIHPGFFLLSINGQETTKINFAKTMKLLHSASRPLTLRFLATYSPVHVAQAEFSSRLIAAWPFDKIMHWEAKKNTFAFDNYEGDGSPVEHVSFSTREAQEIQDFLEAKTSSGEAAGSSQVDSKLVPAFALAVQAATRFSSSEEGAKSIAAVGGSTALSSVPAADEASSVQAIGFESQKITSYVVALGEGPLGLQMVDCTANGTNLSGLVDKVSGASAGSGVLPGHFLFSVNSEDVTCLTFKETMSSLKSATRPLELRFWTAPPSPGGKYTVTFASQAIGVGFGQSAGRTAVDRVVGLAEDSCIVAVGHLLIGVNGINTEAMSFEKTMDVLAKSSRPIVLEFQLCHKNGDLAPAPTSLTYKQTFEKSAKILGIGFAAVPGLGSAAVESLHPSGAALTSKIQVGDVLLNVNTIDTGQMDFQSTMKVLKQAGRPLTLEFQKQTVPAAGSFRERELGGFRCYTLQDPTGNFPGEVLLVINDVGVQVVACDKRTNVCFWRWRGINSWEPALQSDDPGDMELIKIGVSNMGVFIFECNDARVIARAFQAEVDMLLAKIQKEPQKQQLSSDKAEDAVPQTTQLAFPAVIVDHPGSAMLPTKVVLVPFASSLDILDGTTEHPKPLQRLPYPDIARYGVIPAAGDALPRFKVCITTLSGSEVTYTFETSHAAQVHASTKTAIHDLLQSHRDR